MQIVAVLVLLVTEEPCEAKMSYMMENRTTSAGYRLPLASRPRSSDFHQNCIPKEVKQREAAIAASVPAGAKVSEAEFAKLDVVTQDKIWKQSVDIEQNAVKQWSVGRFALLCPVVKE